MGSHPSQRRASPIPPPHRRSRTRSPAARPAALSARSLCSTQSTAFSLASTAMSTSIIAPARRVLPLLPKRTGRTRRTGRRAARPRERKARPLRAQARVVQLVQALSSGAVAGADADAQQPRGGQSVAAYLRHSATSASASKSSGARGKSWRESGGTLLIAAHLPPSPTRLPLLAVEVGVAAAAAVQAKVQV